MELEEARFALSLSNQLAAVLACALISHLIAIGKSCPRVQLFGVLSFATI